jgi:hypothetical protein
MELEYYSGREDLSEREMAALLAIPSVNNSVKNSALFSMNLMSSRVGNYKRNGKDSEYAPRLVAESFTTDLFPYFKSLKGEYMLGGSKERVLALNNFWILTANALDMRLPGTLERYVLSRDNGAPAVFLGQILSAATQAGRDELVKKYFQPIKVELSLGTFNPNISDNWQ